MVSAVDVVVLHVAEFVQVTEEGEVLQDDMNLLNVNAVFVVFFDGAVDLLGWLLTATEQGLDPVRFLLLPPRKEHVWKHTSVLAFRLNPRSKVRQLVDIFAAVTETLDEIPDHVDFDIIVEWRFTAFVVLMFLALNLPPVLRRKPLEQLPFFRLDVIQIVLKLRQGVAVEEVIKDT